MNIRKTLWGKWKDRDVYLFEMQHPCGMRASISNYGGVLQSLWVQNARGEMLDVALGYDRLEDYIRGDCFFGAMIGPIADRLAEGRLQVNGQEVRLAQNAGPDCMHSGAGGFHARLWDWEILADGVALELHLAPEDGLLPGRLDVRVIYRMPRENCLRIETAARCDCETLLSFTNHSYFNLNGGKGDCLGHSLRVHADTYAETRREADPICTGRTLPVDGTPLDLRAGCRLGDVLRRTDFSEIRRAGGLDHYFPISGAGMREHARLRCAESGLEMRCTSNAPGVLIYSANGLNAEAGKGGAIYGKNWALCMETERFPNAANFPQWRDQALLPSGEIDLNATEFSFLQI